MATSDQSPRPRGILGYVLPSRFNARTAIWLVNSRRTLHLSQYSDRSILPQQNLLSLLLFGFLRSNEGLEKWHSNYWIRLSYDMKNYVDRGGYNRLVEKDTLSPGTSRFAVPFSVDILQYSEYWWHFTGYRKRLPNLVNVDQLWRSSQGLSQSETEKCFEWIMIRWLRLNLKWLLHVVKFNSFIPSSKFHGKPINVISF